MSTLRVDSHLFAPYGIPTDFVGPYGRAEKMSNYPDLVNFGWLVVTACDLVEPEPLQSSRDPKP
jgi:hypothetical protein